MPVEAVELKWKTEACTENPLSSDDDTHEAMNWNDIARRTKLFITRIMIHFGWRKSFMET